MLQEIDSHPTRVITFVGYRVPVVHTSPDSTADSKGGPASLLCMASNIRSSTTWGMLNGP